MMQALGRLVTLPLASSRIVTAPATPKSLERSVRREIRPQRADGCGSRPRAPAVWVDRRAFFVRGATPGHGGKGTRTRWEGCDALFEWLLGRSIKGGKRRGCVRLSKSESAELQVSEPVTRAETPSKTPAPARERSQRKPSVPGEKTPCLVHRGDLSRAKVSSHRVEVSSPPAKRFSTSRDLPLVRAAPAVTGDVAHRPFRNSALSRRTRHTPVTAAGGAGWPASSTADVRCPHLPSGVAPTAPAYTGREDVAHETLATINRERQKGSRPHPRRRPVRSMTVWRRPGASRRLSIALDPASAATTPERLRRA